MKKIQQCRICKSFLSLSSFWKYKKPNTKFLINKGFTYYHTCKNCCLKTIDSNNPQSFLPILEEMNIPYLESIYNEYLEFSNSFGRYLARMRLGNLYDLEYKIDAVLPNGELILKDSRYQGGIEEDV